MPRHAAPAALLVSLLLAATSHAATGGTPITLTHTGYLLSNADLPITGTLALTFRVFDPGGTVQWAGTCGAVSVASGYYAVALGTAACPGSTAGGLDPTLETSDVPVTGAGSLEIEIAGVTLSPRVPLRPQPTATLAERALDADALAGRTVGTGANGLVALDPSAKLPAVDGSLLTHVDAEHLSGHSVGTAANELIALDASAKLPAVDGSQLTNVNAAKLAGRSIGTGANAVLALDANAKVPAVDGSQLTNVDALTLGGAGASSTSGTNTLVKRDGTGSFAASTVTATGVVTGTLKVTGGSPSLGRVLTSDGVGNATWADPATVDTSALVPIGTVISSLIAPDASTDYMTGSTTWAFADGTLPASASTYTGPFPDMRGQFLRGMNGTRADARKDPDTRTVGSQQIDAFQGHRHSMAEAWGFTGSGSNQPPSSPGRSSVSSTLDPISDGTNGGPRVASETRPGNIAVYWYIKVK